MRNHLLQYKIVASRSSREYPCGVLRIVRATRRKGASAMPTRSILELRRSDVDVLAIKDSSQ